MEKLTWRVRLVHEMRLLWLGHADVNGWMSRWTTRPRLFDSLSPLTPNPSSCKNQQNLENLSRREVCKSSSALCDSTWVLTWLGGGKELVQGHDSVSNNIKMKDSNKKNCNSK